MSFWIMELHCVPIIVVKSTYLPYMYIQGCCPSHWLSRLP